MREYIQPEISSVAIRVDWKNDNFGFWLCFAENSDLCKKNTAPVELKETYTTIPYLQCRLPYYPLYQGCCLRIDLTLQWMTEYYRILRGVAGWGWKPTIPENLPAPLQQLIESWDQLFFLSSSFYNYFVRAHGISSWWPPLPLEILYRRRCFVERDRRPTAATVRAHPSLQ